MPSCVEIGLDQLGERRRRALRGSHAPGAPYPGSGAPGEVVGGVVAHVEPHPRECALQDPPNPRDRRVEQIAFGQRRALLAVVGDRSFRSWNTIGDRLRVLESEQVRSPDRHRRAGEGHWGFWNVAVHARVSGEHGCGSNMPPDPISRARMPNRSM